MGLLSLTKDGVSLLIDENDIVRVYSLNSVTKVEYFKANEGTIDTIDVSESLATIDAASDTLIELTKDGIAFLLNYTNIRQVLTEGSGSKVIYEKLQTQTVIVEETPAQISTLINSPSTEPLRYKALLSQNAPVATTQTPTIIAGQIWEDTIGTANAGDLVILGGYELISGTLGAVNAKYRSATDDTPNFTTASLEYDGSPYVVSTDANGDLNPFVDTTGVVVSFAYGNANKQYIYLPTIALIEKTSLKISQNDVDGTNLNNIYNDGDNTIIVIKTTSANALNYTLVEIEVYP